MTEDTTPDPKTDTIPLVEAEVTNDVQVVINNDKKAEVKKVAERFVDLVKHGEKPGEAARMVGTTLREIGSRDDLKKFVSRLIGDFHLEAAVQKELVSAGLTKLFTEAVRSPDIEDRKLALAVGKQLSQNLGIVAADGTVTVDLGSLGDVLKDIKLEGIPDYKDAAIPITKEEPNENS